MLPHQYISEKSVQIGSAYQRAIDNRPYRKNVTCSVLSCLHPFHLSIFPHPQKYAPKFIDNPDYLGYNGSNARMKKQYHSGYAARERVLG